MTLPLKKHMSGQMEQPSVTLVGTAASLTMPIRNKTVSSSRILASGMMLSVEDPGSLSARLQHPPPLQLQSPVVQHQLQQPQWLLQQSPFLHLISVRLDGFTLEPSATSCSLLNYPSMMREQVVDVTMEQTWFQ